MLIQSFAKDKVSAILRPRWNALFIVIFDHRRGVSADGGHDVCTPMLPWNFAHEGKVLGVGRPVRLERFHRREGNLGQARTISLARPNCIVPSIDVGELFCVWREADLNRSAALKEWRK